MVRMEPADAQALWLAPKTRSDQFLLYAFDCHGDDPDRQAAELHYRASAVDDLNLAVWETPALLDYPYWVPRPAATEQIVIVTGGTCTWQQCTADLADRMAEQLDSHDACWRLLLYPRVTGPPDGGGECAVVVLQIAHVLGDGRRVAAIARSLFGAGTPAAGTRPAASPRPLHAAVRGAARLPWQLGAVVTRGRRALAAARDAPPAGNLAPVQAGRFNTGSAGVRSLRTLVVDADDLRIGTHGVTVGALVAISQAMCESGMCESGAHGQPELRVELAIGRTEPTPCRNNYFTAGVETHPDVADHLERADLIAAGIAAARRRDAAPERVAARHAEAATPAVLMRWGAAAFEPETVAPTVGGHTVVSSVDRGAADLRLLDAPVRFTAGFPATSPRQGLTHGVHGIGGTVAISVHTGSGCVPDVDAYLTALARAVDGLPRGQFNQSRL